MKLRIVLFISITTLLYMSSCIKGVDNINPCTHGVYSKWSVATINVKSYVFPMGVVWDTTYNGIATDYIDLSIKGKIDFFIV